ncbi:MAG: ABC transporter permease, partial [Roseovarius sp.]|nr:ABC transporter permease [Roseovarius sp.]
MSRLITIATSTALALVLWQALVTLAALPPFILPGPGRVAETFWASRALIAHHATITAAEVLLGLALGAILGGLSAIGLASSPMARRLIRPMMVFSQAIPVFALA